VDVEVLHGHTEGPLERRRPRVLFTQQLVIGDDRLRRVSVELHQLVDSYGVKRVKVDERFTTAEGLEATQCLWDSGRPWAPIRSRRVHRGPPEIAHDVVRGPLRESFDEPVGPIPSDRIRGRPPGLVILVGLVLNDVVNKMHENLEELIILTSEEGEICDVEALQLYRRRTTTSHRPIRLEEIGAVGHARGPERVARAVAIGDPHGIARDVVGECRYLDPEHLLMTSDCQGGPFLDLRDIGGAQSRIKVVDRLGSRGQRGNRRCWSSRLGSRGQRGNRRCWSSRPLTCIDRPLLLGRQLLRPLDRPSRRLAHRLLETLLHGRINRNRISHRCRKDASQNDDCPHPNSLHGPKLP